MLYSAGRVSDNPQFSVAADPALEQRHLEFAAKHDHTLAQYELALMYKSSGKCRESFDLFKAGA